MNAQSEMVPPPVTGSQGVIRTVDELTRVKIFLGIQAFFLVVSVFTGGFNFKQFRSNVVFRWEYRPGSTVFLVWSQGRQAFNPFEGTDNFRGNLRDLFGQRADDVFLVKFSYWLGR